MSLPTPTPEPLSTRRQVLTPVYVWETGMSFPATPPEAGDRMPGPTRYRKRPVVIEAMQFTGDRANFEVLWAWACPSDDTLQSPLHCGNDPEDGSDDYSVLHVKTPEGTMRANPGDWIIKGVAGEFYPVKDEIFRATYEAAS